MKKLLFLQIWYHFHLFQSCHIWTEETSKGVNLNSASYITIRKCWLQAAVVPNGKWYSKLRTVCTVWAVFFPRVRFEATKICLLGNSKQKPRHWNAMCIENLSLCFIFISSFRILKELDIHYTTSILNMRPGGLLFVAINT